MPGIMLPRGAQLRLAPGSLGFRMTDDGQVEVDPVSPELRVEMWPHWLHESVDGAIAVLDVRAAIAAELGALAGPTPPTDEQGLQDLLDAELRASMRTISAAAFAVDAFYASVQARSPDHPHRETWRTPRANGRRTSRHTIVFETLRYHLKVRPAAVPEYRRRISDLFRFRGWAVHADANFRPAVERPDLNRGVDWHYVAFSADNAVAVVGGTLQMLSALVDVFGRGSEEMRAWQPHAREALDTVITRYDAEDRLPRLQWRKDDASGVANQVSSPSQEDKPPDTTRA
ncbi:hypothetical protein FE374_04385 [Georgenia yuyongxinii]|uniref:Uncharacterized protein n=1 Tax=Georgenia yuyongxinii TaxID=2589797 RepID=A0A5B8C397_9MICO|nr:hypothetical protein [Georgenia yuyongxinii]QDC23971.1 hypothetical protein FE374_04385 [Georgenia yuyongxinii]